jgi:hypothetical protein
MFDLKSMTLEEQLEIALDKKQEAFYKKDNRGFNFWCTQIELIKNKIRMS